MNQQVQTDLQQFCKGESDNAYMFMGCHKDIKDGQKGYTFRVWAPNARRKLCL